TWAGCIGNAAEIASRISRWIGAILANRIIPRPAIHQLIRDAVAGGNGIGPIIPAEHVNPRPAVDRIIAATARDVVIAAAAGQRVVAVAAEEIDRNRNGRSIDAVIAIQAIDYDAVHTAE